MAQIVVTGPTKAVASAGSAEQISTSAIAVTSIYIEADKDNTGNIYVGDSNVSSARYTAKLAAGEGVTLKADQIPRQDDELILSDYYIDADVNAESAQISYIKRR